MKAQPEAQRDLLRLQSIDTRLAQLAHRLGSLPQTAALAELGTRGDVVRSRRATAVGALEDARAELARLESDVAMVEARMSRDNDRMTHTASMKDVAALESELASLAKRRSDLEDQELAVMERVEEAEAEVAGVDGEAAEIADRARALEGERGEASDVLVAERTAAERDREVVARELPADLVALYEQRRIRGGGVGAALLQHRTCSGCTITLTGSDLDRVRRAAPDEVLQCPECDRILVRTDESGL